MSQVITVAVNTRCEPFSLLRREHKDNKYMKVAGNFLINQVKSPIYNLLRIFTQELGATFTLILVKCVV